MKLKLTFFTFILSTLATSISPSTLAADLVINNAVLFDATGSVLKPNTSIVIENGKIKSIHQNKNNIQADTVIDAKGKTLMPGLINAHLHLFWNMYDLPPKMPATNDTEAKAFIHGELYNRLYGHLSQGITSILSPIDFAPYIYDVRQKVEKGEIKGPRVFAAGPVLMQSGEYYACAGLVGKDLEWCNQHVRLPIDTPEQARASVEQLVKYQSDVVVYDGLTNQAKFNKPALIALVDEAHKHNLKVLVHNANAKDVPDMVAAGVDTFIHPPTVTKDIDGKFLQILGNKKLPIAITLGFMERYIGLGFASDKDKNDYEIMTNNIQVALKAGATPIFTSDVPGIPPKEVIPMVTKVMKGQGIDNTTILLSATREAAKALGQNNLGTIEVGKVADLILIDGNPIQDISALQRVKLVIKDGVIAVDQRHR